MKITRVETFLVPPRWLFCRVETDDGLVGWGEPVVEGRAETTRAAVHELADLLLGADPRRVEDLWQTMTKAAFYRGGPVLSSAVAASTRRCGTSSAARSASRRTSCSAARSATGSGCTAGSAGTSPARSARRPP